MSIVLRLDKEAVDHGFIHLKRAGVYEPYRNRIEEDELAYELGFDTVRLASDSKIALLDVFLGDDPLDFLDYLIENAHKVKGTYTVEELGLHDVPFVEVLKAIKKLYEKKLTTPTQK